MCFWLSGKVWYEPAKSTVRPPGTAENLAGESQSLHVVLMASCMQTLVG